MALPARQTALSSAIRALSASSEPGCILDPTGAFLFANEAWERLPAGAGGPPYVGAPLVGRAFADCLPEGPLRGACAAAIDDALAGRGRLPRVLAGEWNDAETARLVSTRIEPLTAADGVIGLLLRRSVVRERPVIEVYEIGDRGDAAYRGAGGEIVQCPCCRRVRDDAERERWDFVPRLAGRAGDAAALCELCAELHVGASAA